MNENLTRIITAVNFSAPNSAINEEAGTISGIKVLSCGEAKGYGKYVDSTMLSQALEAGRKQRNGVKCSFGHGKKLGSALGRFKNFFVDGEDLRADLHLAEAARKSPLGDIYNYTLALARSDSDLAGMSISFAKGKPETDAKGRECFRLSKLEAIDLVDDPAAVTGGMFEAKNDEVETYNLSTNAEIEQMANESLTVELEAKKAEIETSKKTIIDLETKSSVQAQEIVSLSAKVAEMDKIKADKEAADAKVVEFEAVKAGKDAADKQIAELSAKIAKDAAEFAVIRDEWVTFKKGTAPLSVKPTDEVKKKSIFKNI